MPRLVVLAHQRLAIHEDGRGPLSGAPHVRSAAYRVYAHVIDAERGSTVDVDVARTNDRWPNAGMRAPRTTMRILLDLCFVAQPCRSWHLGVVLAFDYGHHTPP